MRKVIVMVLTLSITAFAKINWVDYEDAFIKAKKENKIIMIYIYSPDCHYCKEMDATTFKDPDVQEIINRYFIPVKVRKCLENGLEVGKEYGYLGTPTFHFIQPNGKKIKSIFGAWRKKDFLQILRYFYEEHYKKKSMTEYFLEQ